jgi:hypothetical protein
MSPKETERGKHTSHRKRCLLHKASVNVPSSAQSQFPVVGYDLDEGLNSPPRV